MPGEPVLRAAVPDDREFQLSVYASTRREELAGAGLSEEQFNAFVRMQFDLQSRHYGAVFPDAVTSVVEVDGVPAGRLIVDRRPGEILVVDLALLARFRDGGVGTKL